ncbi:TetR/AcrR family transcriptional regulator [Sulfitobacter aestuarii]|uniref:TetR/AcrR family transcriptional regulator n=1 Tax=Sulfitobacter aestuarii TaxID=2161676 RepID=A0ABW5U5B5_9RHOB
MQEQPGDQRKQQKRGEKTTRRVLDAARRLIAKGGFDAAQLSQVSRESGVSTGSLYHHFGSKEGIFTRLIEEFADQAVADLQALDLAELDFDARLRRLLDLTCAQFRNNPELYRSMSERVKAMPDIWVPLRELRKEFETRMRAELSDSLRARGVAEPDAAIHRMMQVVLGLLTHSVVFSSGPVSVEEPTLENQIFTIGYAIILLPTCAKELP